MSTDLQRVGVAMLLALVAPLLAVVQSVASPAAEMASMRMTEAEARTTVRELADVLAANFVYPETGERYAAALRAKLAAGGYAGIADPKAFAEQVTKDLQAAAPDGHLRLYAPQTRTPVSPRPASASAIDEAKWIADGIAYIRFSGFPRDPATLAAVDRFMTDHATARALIIDARGHNGGGVAPVDVMLPYLYAKPAVLGVMETRAAADAAGRFPFADAASMHVVPSPENVVRREHRVVPHATEKRLFDAKVVYLTSKRTASAAEGLALAFKRTGRATLIGETTRGAGHFGMIPTIGRFSAFVPIGRTYDPATGKGWEGTGVEPDVKVPADQALDEALKRLGVKAPVTQV